MNGSLLKAGLLLLSLFVAQVLGAAPSVTQIAAGDSHSLFIKSDGSLWAMGNNDSGQLGDGTFNSTNRPVEIVSSGVVAVAAGSSYSLFIKSDGSLWGMGYNTTGQLGDGSIIPTNRPELIVSNVVSNGVIAIACYDHSLFVKADGSLWAMGDNYWGELGDGTYNSSLVPEKIVSSGVVAVAAGWGYSLFLKSNGSLWGMGYNSAGDLGDGTFDQPTRPEQIIAGGVTAIAAGENPTSLFVKSDGSLWGMGENYDGELGRLTDASSPYGDQFIAKPGKLVPSNVVAISEGGNQTLFIKSDGSLWGMGSSSLGELGDGTFDASNAQPEQIVAGGVVAVAAGNGHSLFIKSDGSLWAMGDNSSGQLGDGFSGTDAITANGDFSGSVVPEQIYPSPAPVLNVAISSETNLQFQAACQFGGTFTLLAGTDLAVPLNQWTPVWTNVITSRTNNIFTATLTNAISANPARQFYIFQPQ